MNYDAKIEGGKLVIIVDVSDKALAAAEPSKTGKSKLVASTRGFTGFGKIKLSMNVTTG